MPPLQPSFASLGVPSDIVAALDRKSITEPFPIQSMTIPDALAGRDVCGKAPTGSGKTLAFGIGAVARLTGKPARPRHPRVLVLTPTRELAAQVASELQVLATPRNLRVDSFYGGVGYGPQLKALSRGVDVAVACPGRLGDLIERGSIRLDAVEIVVIDEADRMADMGFLPDVKRLLDLTPADRQTLLFSATLDGDIDVLVRRYQNDPARHELEVDEDDTSAAVHLFWRVASGDRVDRTADVVAAAGPTIVFCRTKHGTDRIARQLEQRGVRAAAIHGDRSQKQREKALDLFVRGAVDALVATDVAARGIHVDGVNAVVHFDPPADAKDYVHRSGRTARAGATGVVVSFVTPDKAGGGQAAPARPRRARRHHRARPGRHHRRDRDRPPARTRGAADRAPGGTGRWRRGPSRGGRNDPDRRRGTRTGKPRRSPTGPDRSGYGPGRRHRRQRTADRQPAGPGKPGRAQPGKPAQAGQAGVVVGPAGPQRPRAGRRSGSTHGRRRGGPSGASGRRGRRGSGRAGAAPEPAGPAGTGGTGACRPGAADALDRGGPGGAGPADRRPSIYSRRPWHPTPNRPSPSPTGRLRASW